MIRATDTQTWRGLSIGHGHFSPVPHAVLGQHAQFLGSLQPLRSGGCVVITRILEKETEAQRG